MKSLMLLWRSVAQEYEQLCRVSTTRDFHYVTRRIEDEGESFLTITLPSLSKALERGLAEERVDPSFFVGFTCKGSFPRFLSGFFGLIFERDTGRLLDEPSIDAIQAIRQLTLMFGKVRLECKPFRIDKAFRDFIECEQEVRSNDMRLQTHDLLGAFTRMSRLLFWDSLSRLDFDVQTLGIIPQHGPGSTADRLVGNAKFVQTEWPERLDSCFPLVDYIIPNARYYQYLDSVTLLEPGAERPVKVVAVPKTLKTPRIIAIEPTAMQYAQQGLREKIYEYLEDDKLVSPMIGFTDQTPNQEMARLGSLTGNLATLDLSEASDRVSNQLVRAMLKPHRHAFDAVDACRSRSADVPGYGVQRLAKFASMGSALCFPIEAMVFLSIVFVGIERALNRPVTKKDVKSLHGRVRVYGDDIIVPVEYTRFVVESLEAYGLKVNSHKSFWTGKFRESCGKEYYAGHDVSVVKVRDLFPSTTKDAEECISLVSLRNQFYMNGLWQTVRYMDEIIEKTLRGFFPTVLPTSPVLGKWSLIGFQTDKLHKDFHSPLVRGWMKVGKSPINPIDDYHALVKWFLKRGPNPFEDKDHLLRSGRPLAVRIKLGYGSSF